MRHALPSRVLLALLLATGLARAETIVHTERSLYRNIVVFDDNGLRCMKFSRVAFAGRQSCQLMRDPRQLVFDYTRMMMGALYLNPEPTRVLVLGLGGATLPSALAALPGSRDID